jgi:hypothetical protein
MTLLRTLQRSPDNSFLDDSSSSAEAGTAASHARGTRRSGGAKIKGLGGSKSGPNKELPGNFDLAQFGYDHDALPVICRRKKTPVAFRKVRRNCSMAAAPLIRLSDPFDTSTVRMMPPFQ